MVSNKIALITLIVGFCFYSSFCYPNARHLAFGFQADRANDQANDQANDRADEQARLKRMRRINPDMPQPMPIDDQRVAAAGISVLHGKHITLFTDFNLGDAHGSQTSPQEWVALFDAAVVGWCEAFDIDQTQAKDYKIRAMIIVSAERFRQARLIPNDLPKFPAGYSRGHEFWMFAQSDDYYTRHLILHEGTHAFMNWFLGSTGPPWYSEGMAEWMALHQWTLPTKRNLNQENAPTLTLKAKIPSSDVSQGWGRIGRIKKMVADNKAMSLDDVLNIPPSAFRNVDYYAWSWAACEFFSEHPLSARAFARLPDKIHQDRQNFAQFNQSFASAIKPHRQALDRDWSLFINEIDYGYNVQATRLTRAQPINSRAKPKPVRTGNQPSVKTFQILARQSWQSTGLKFKQGDQIEIRATGQFVLGETTKPWISQADGITINYYAGQPLGRLMACIAGEPVTDEAVADVTPFEAISIGGRPTAISIPQDGSLWLRINESPTKLQDNSGHLEVSIFKLK